MNDSGLRAIVTVQSVSKSLYIRLCRQVATPRTANSKPHSAG